MTGLPELEVRVAKSGDNYAWGIHFLGCNEPVRFSVPIFVSENDARAAGEKVLQTSIRKRRIQNSMMRPGGNRPDNYNTPAG